MNIFEFLGLPADHRKETKVTQLVKHYDEVVEKNKEGKTWALQTKKDGVCTLLVIRDGIPKLFSRTGKAFTNYSHMLYRVKRLEMQDGVYMAEWWVPKAVASLEVFSGIVNPNRKKPISAEQALVLEKATLSMFDRVSCSAFISGCDDNNFKLRHGILTQYFNQSQPSTGHIEVLQYNIATTEEQIRHSLGFLLSGGEEGIIIRDVNANWEAGHKGWRVMKIVRGVDYDLLCVGAEEKFKGKVANLLFSWKGGLIIRAPLGKGWTHQMAEEMWNEYISNHTDSPANKIHQVYALEESSKGKLRLPKVGEKRFDKGVPDV